MKIRLRLRRECDTCKEYIYFDVLDADDGIRSYTQVTHLTRERAEVTERSDAFGWSTEITDMGPAMLYALAEVMRHTGCLEYARPLF